MSVGAHRFSLRGALLEGSGYAYQYAARVNALSQVLVMASRIPVLSAVAGNLVVTSLAGATDQALECCPRIRVSYSASHCSWPFNTALENLVFAAASGVVVNDSGVGDTRP